MISNTDRSNGYLIEESGSTKSGVSFNVKNQTTAIGSTTFNYTGATQTERVQETNNNGTVSFVNSGLGLSSKTNSNGSIYYTHCSCGELIGDCEPGGNKYYYLLDAQGSVVATTDSSGTLVDGYVYEPFGTLLESHEPHANPWQFQSGYYDNSTGLYKFGTRYYDPTVGRWTQLDSVGGSLADVQGLNRYLFVGDDPVNQVDPSGQQPLAPALMACLHGASIAFFIAIAFSFTAILVTGQVELVPFFLEIEGSPIVGCLLEALFSSGG